MTTNTEKIAAALRVATRQLAEPECKLAPTSDTGALVEICTILESISAFSPVQIKLEEWLNADPEMRYAEVLIGQSLRIRVRLHKIVFDERGTEQVAEFEAGTLEAAIIGAVDAVYLEGEAKQ
jgi:hypothetical protein